MHRGFTPRSLKSASCRRRTRFSASTDRRGLIESATKPAKSASTRRTMRAKAITRASCHRFAYRSQAQWLDSIFADHTFCAAPQRVLSREQLLDLSRLHNAEVYDRSIDVQILRLRRKIETDPTHPEYIKTERGVGYIFDAHVEIVH